MRLRQHRRLRLPRRSPGPSGALKGCMRQVIVVKPPDERFREAIFILRDDYLADPQADREALLRQAREAARRCAAQLAPAQRGRPRLVWLLPPLTALGALAAHLLGLW